MDPGDSMATNKRRKKNRVTPSSSDCARGDSSRAVDPRKDLAPELDSSILRRHAHVDDLVRVIRNLAALALICSAASALVAYAGIQMGVPPEVCWVGSVGSGPLLVRTFIKLFETVRPSLPDAPEDPPSNGAP